MRTMRFKLASKKKTAKYTVAQVADIDELTTKLNAHSKCLLKMMSSHKMDNGANFTAGNIKEYLQKVVATMELVKPLLDKCKPFA